MPHYTNDTYFLSISLGKPQGATQQRGHGSVVRTIYEPNEADHADNSIVWIGIPDAGKIVSMTFAISGTPHLDIYPEVFYAAPGCSLELDEVGSDYSHTETDGSETPLGPVPVFIAGENSKIEGTKIRVQDADAVTDVDVAGGVDTRYRNIGFGSEFQGSDRWSNTGGVSQTAGYSLEDEDGNTIVFDCGRELTESTSYVKDATGPNATGIEQLALTLDENSLDKDDAKPFSDGGFLVEKESVLIVRSRYGSRAQQEAKMSQWAAWHLGKADGLGGNEGSLGPPFYSAYAAEHDEEPVIGIPQTTELVSNNNPLAYKPQKFIEGGNDFEWEAGATYSVDDVVASGLVGARYKYRCTFGGDSTNAPTGTDSEITDEGSLRWECLDGSSGRSFPGGDAVKGYRLGGHKFYAPYQTGGAIRYGVTQYPFDSGQIDGGTTNEGNEMGVVVTIDRTGVE